AFFHPEQIHVPQHAPAKARTRFREGLHFLPTAGESDKAPSKTANRLERKSGMQVCLGSACVGSQDNALRIQFPGLAAPRASRHVPEKSATYLISVRALHRPVPRSHA